MSTKPNLGPEQMPKRAIDDAFQLMAAPEAPLAKPGKSKIAVTRPPKTDPKALALAIAKAQSSPPSKESK